MHAGSDIKFYLDTTIEVPGPPGLRDVGMPECAVAALVVEKRGGFAVLDI